MGAQGEETAFQSAQNQISAELEEMGLSKISKSVQRSAAAARAGFNQGRTGGAFSSSKAMVSPAIAEAGTNLLKTAQLNVQAARNRRAYYEKQLAKAQKAKNTDLAEHFSQRIAESQAREAATIAQAERDSMEMEQMTAAITTKATSEAMDRMNVLADSPSTASMMSVPDLSALAVQAGYTESTAATLASGIIADANTLLEAQKSKDVLATQTALLNYQKAVQSLENPVLEKIEGYKRLKLSLEAGEISQDNFDK